MGQLQDTQRGAGTPSRRRVGARNCLRRGCDSVYLPSRWNQRYCRDPDCQREVRRWQAAKRQRVHRQSPANRQRHAESEAERRRRLRATRPTPEDGLEPRPASDSRAWSRGEKIPEDFCDRPGCYEAVDATARAPSKYCGRDCRQALRQVLDRERKWLFRNTYAGQLQRQREYQRSRAALETRSMTMRETAAAMNVESVGDYRNGEGESLACQAIEPRQSLQVKPHGHSKANLDPRSRPPPSE